MSYQVLHDGFDISSYVTGFDRTEYICSGIGTLKVELEAGITRTFNLFDEVVLYEDGIKKKTTFIKSIERTAPEYRTTLNCQDASVLLQDYFITDNYLVDYPSRASYWIELFLDEAGIGYSFVNTSGGDNLLPNNTALGMISLYDQIQYLLQMNGWFIRFDENNNAEIGKFAIDTDNYDLEVNDDEYDLLNFIDEDKMYRNRALVYGMGDASTGSWISAELDVSGQSSNEYDSNDIRTVVIASPYIPDQATAYGLASQIIKEFHRVVRRVEIQLIGFRDIYLGDQVFLNSEFGRMIGTVTTVSVTSVPTGITTSITLNQRCPRIFGYFDYGGYVYAGTDGNGVWRKHLKFDHTWSDYSTGLADLYITDLHIANGVFVCTTREGHLYTRIAGSASWVRVSATFEDTETLQVLTEDELVFSACTINRVDSSIHAVASISGFVFGSPTENNPKSWILQQTGTQIVTNQLLYQTNPELYAIDIDNDGQLPYITTLYGETLAFANSSVVVNSTPKTSIQYDTLFYIKQGYNTREFPYPFRNISAYQDKIYGTAYYSPGNLWYGIQYSPSTEQDEYIQITTGQGYFYAYTAAIDSNRSLVYGSTRPGISDAGSIIFNLLDFNPGLPTIDAYSLPGGGAVYGGYFDPTTFVVTFMHGFDSAALQGTFFDAQTQLFYGTTDIEIEVKYDFIVSTLSFGVARLDDTFYGIVKQIEDNAGDQISRYFSFKFSTGGLFTSEIESWEDSARTPLGNNVNAIVIDVPGGYAVQGIFTGSEYHIFGINMVNLVVSDLVDMSPIVGGYVSFYFANSQNKVYLVRSTSLLPGGDVTKVDFFSVYDLVLLQTLEGNILVSNNLDYFSNEILISEDEVLSSYYNISTDQRTLLYSGYSSYPVFVGSRAVFGDSIVYPLQEFPVVVPILFSYENSTLSPILISELPARIELSNNAPPYVVYGNATVSFSGSTNSGILYHSWVNNGDFFNYSIPGFNRRKVFDARSAYEMSPSGLEGITLFTTYTPSGLGEISVLRLDSVGSVFADTYYPFPSGYPEMLETDNFNDYPYLFVSTSGDRYRFWQRDGYNTGFIPENYGLIDRTGGLPDSRITVIRLDERL